MPESTFVGEEFPMTMQVAMVGTDGIVLASDLLWVDNNVRIMSSQLSPKIKLSPKCDLAVSFARSLETSGPIADAILALKDSAWESPVTSIEAAARQVLDSPIVGRKDVQCLIVSTKPKLDAYLLRVAQLGGVWTPSCQNVLGYAWAGDDSNPAVFWIKKYYEHRPISALLPLAAQLIVSASEMNSGGIEGLEIVLCYQSGIKRQADDVTIALELEAKKRSRAVGELIFGSAAGY